MRKKSFVIRKNLNSFRIGKELRLLPKSIGINFFLLSKLAQPLLNPGGKPVSQFTHRLVNPELLLG
jgi:hypothetical protein